MTTKIQFHGDPTCPYCYLGLSRFEIARLEFPEDVLDLSIAPFQISPEMPVNGMPYEAYLLARYGTQLRVAEALLPLSENAPLEDIPLALEKISVMPNTLKAFRLLHWARELGVDYPLFRLMQNAHFAEGIDIGEDASLCALAEEIGMDGQIVAALLPTEKAEEEVLAEIRAHTKAGIREVPAWVVGGTYVVQGAQSINFWRNVIGEIDEKGRALAQKTVN